MTLTKYEQVMERVHMTGEARSRALAAMRAPQPAVRFPARREMGKHSQQHQIKKAPRHPFYSLFFLLMSGTSGPV